MQIPHRPVRPHRPGRAAVAALTLPALLLAAFAARADVDLELPARSDIEGTVGPNETEVFRVNATAGSELTLNIAGERGSDLDFVVLDPDDQIVDLTAALKDGGHKLKVRKLTLSTAGLYTLRLSTDRGTTFRLKSATKPVKKVKREIELGEAATTTVDLPAPWGSDVKLVAKRGRGSSVVPRFGLLTDGGAVNRDLSGDGKTKDKFHKVTVEALGGNGDFDLTVRNDSTGTGTVLVQGRVKAPRTAKMQLDVSDAARGGSEYDETVLARIVGLDGADLTIDDPASELDGAGAVFPFAAFGNPQFVMVSSTNRMVLTGTEPRVVGPTVVLEPAGLFAPTLFEVRVPFDTDDFPEGTGTEDLLVRVESENGTNTFSPRTLDLANGLAILDTVNSGRFTCVVPLPD